MTVEQINVGPSERGRNAGLDVARSVAIGMVFFSHVLTFGGGLPDLVVTLLNFMGHAGVELFFSLSGFLIGGILVRLAEGGLGFGAVAGFMVRRWFRTLPLYFAVMGFVTWWLGMSGGHGWWLLQNFYPGEPRPIPVSWSLVMEEYFYFFFPLGMMAFGVVLGGGARLVLATGVALIVGCNAARLWDWGLSAEAVHEHPFLRMDCAAYGAVAAWVAAAWPEWVRAVGRRAGWVVCGGFVAMAGWGGLFAVAAHWPGGWWRGAYGVVQYSMLDLIFAVVVMGLAAGPQGVWPGVGWAVRWVSLLSYSIYLNHLSVILWLSDKVPGGLSGVRIGATVGATLAASAFTYVLIERPFLWIRDRVIAGRPAQSARVMAL